MAFAERIKAVLTGDKGRKILILGAVAVMLLLMLSTFSCGGKSIEPSRVEEENAAEIEKTLEKRLVELVSSIEGAGNVSVMVTLDTVSERVYEKDRKFQSEEQGTAENARQKNDLETEVVLAGSSKDPLQIGTVQPKVRGAAVVCSGAADPVICEKVTRAVAGALNISTSRVYVTY